MDYYLGSIHKFCILNFQQPGTEQLAGKIF